MNQELNSHYVKVIVDLIIFLEFSDEDTVDPDAAVQAMENIAYELGLMGNQDKKALIQKIDELSEQYSGKQKDFVKRLPIDFGLI